MKNHEYDPALPHGMAEAGDIASRYGIVKPWASEFLQKDDNRVQPSTELNPDGLELLRRAREMEWDHHNFFYYEKLGINWFQVASILSLIEFTGIPMLSNGEVFQQPAIAKQFQQKKIYNDPDPWVNRYGTRLLETDRKVVKVKTIWDAPEPLKIDPLHYEWSFHPNSAPDLLTHENMSSFISRGSKTTKRESFLEILELLGNSKLHLSLEREAFMGDFWYDFTTLLSQHGLFTGIWFEKHFKLKMVRNLAGLKIHAREYESLFQEAYGLECDLEGIAGHIFWQMLFRSINDGEIAGRMHAWVEEFSKPKHCAICGELFSPILLAPDNYFGSNGNTLVCFGCVDPETPAADDLQPLIKRFVESCGFPPPDGVTPRDWRVNVKIPHERQVAVIKAWLAMGGIHHVKNSLNESWFTAMYEAGALPEGTVPTGIGIKCIAVDGHECGSLDEKTIDDLLSERGIAHAKEPKYPHHKTLNPNGLRRADWKVDDTWIEYFGLSGNSGYDKVALEKLELAAEEGLKLIALYPEDMINLDDALIMKLN